MIAALTAGGWRRTAAPEEAGTIIVNSCGFIEPAKQESIDTALAFASAYPAARIVMAGCLSQRYPDELAREMPELAAVVGNRDPARIAEFLRSLDLSPQRVFLPPGPASSLPRKVLLSLPGSAYVKIAEGCDNRCSFCAIPLIRGGLRSRPSREIASEVRELLDAGVVEINLVAQDLAAFGRDSGETLTGLLTRLLRDPRTFWLRLLYVYPEHFPPQLLTLCRQDPRLLPYFDIPFQHASRTVLRRMGRSSQADENRALVGRIRDALPEAFIRSTFLVGFYEETDRAFDELLAFQDAVQLDWLGVFAYSPEDGTPAARFEGSLELPDPAVAEARRDAVRERQEAITERRVDRLVGAELDVLVEELVPRESLAIGRCYAHAPEVDGAVVLTTGEERVRPGELVRCRVFRRNGLDVEAAPL